MKIDFKENWHLEIIPATIFGVAVLVLLTLIYLKIDVLVRNI